MKPIILCADDYGQNPVISQAIIDLFVKKRLSATSCMTASPFWLKHAKELQVFDAKTIDIGLHFDLTESPFMLSALPLSKLIIKAYFRKLNSMQLEAEFNAQLDLFLQGVGRLPDFIDGHQHIQQLPVIRDVILRVYEKRLRARHCYIRSVSDSHAWRYWHHSGYKKRLIIQLCGASAWKKKLQQHHIPFNPSFSGVYDFQDALHYSRIFPTFLTKISHNGIIMCHPGQQGDASNDAIADARYHEYRYLLSDEFIKTCQKQGVVVSKFQKN